MTALSILVVGLLLGMAHAAEADHLAAVATLATRQHTLAQTMRQGLAWGVGHALTLLAFGGAVLALGHAVPATVERALEAAVGAMLVVLGADVLRRLARERVPGPAHRHGDGRWPLRALAVGTMHGLAGSAALVVLSLKAAPTVALGLGTIALFGLGSIFGMAALSLAIALPLRFSAAGLGGWHRAATAMVGLFSCGLGLDLVVRIGLPLVHRGG